MMLKWLLFPTKMNSKLQQQYFIVKSNIFDSRPKSKTFFYWWWFQKVYPSASNRQILQNNIFTILVHFLWLLWLVGSDDVKGRQLIQSLSAVYFADSVLWGKGSCGAFQPQWDKEVKATTATLSTLCKWYNCNIKTL